jgi:hypothetical protein
MVKYLTGEAGEPGAMLRYCSTAAVLGLGWFVVLLVPGMTRDWLLAKVPQNVVCLALASVIVAVLCRRFIERADTPWENVIRATVIPYLGCFVFLTLSAAMLWMRSLLYGGLANLHDTVSLYVMGMAAAAISFFVVIPYGLFCQYVMHWVSPSSAA